MPNKTAPNKRSSSKTAGAKKSRSKKPTSASTVTPPPEVTRAVIGYDEDDLMLHGGGSRGASFGRCGGRILGSLLEQDLCNKLSLAGVTHSHAPRHFEVRLAASERVAAYAPMIVLRGRGREGKTVVVEAAEKADAALLDKIMSFRSQYGPEFYVIFIAPEDAIDDIPLPAFDESCTTTDVHTLVSRLAE